MARRQLTHSLKAVATTILADPDTDHFATGIAATTGLQVGTVAPILKRMAADGWLTDVGYRSVGRSVRRYFRVTDLGCKELGAIVADTNKETNP